MTYSLTWLPGVLRASGLTVVELPCWETRGHGDVGPIVFVVCHHTAEKIDADMKPDLRQLQDGRPDLVGPLAQLGLGQDGTYYMICAGKAWHAGIGFWQGITEGNLHSIGIEAENNGLGEVWPEIQLNAYAAGCAAILKYIKQGSTMCVGHKEWALPVGRKIDPNFNMDLFRCRVTKHMWGA